MSKFLFIIAHPDDEAFNCGGLISKIRENHDFFIACFSYGETTGKNKSDIFIQNYRQKNTLILSNKDQEFDLYSQKSFNDYVIDIIKDYQPDYVYTHSIKDLNKDHRIIGEATMIGARPFSNIKGMFAFQNIDNYHFNQFGYYNNNYFISFDKDIMNKKIELCKTYKDDIKQYPHPRSIEQIINKNKYIGSLCNSEYAEVFDIIYLKDSL